MDWLEDYENEIERIFEEAAAETAKFPAPLDELGFALLARLNPLRTNAGTNYISFLLPYWLREQTNSSGLMSRDLAVGNVFAMIHFFLLDDVMDEGTELHSLKVRSSLVLGQLYQTLFQQRYSSYFPSDSPLWKYYQGYIADWASAVSQEGKHAADPRDFRQLARKSAPVKLCAAGMLLISGQLDRMAELEEAIDLVLATLQLSDDWTDWREDLAEEKGNAFLTLVRERLSLPSGQPLDERTVKQAIYRTDALDKLAEIVRDHGERLKKIAHVPASLIEFQETIAMGLRKDADSAEETTIKLASGGSLSYFLSNITIN
ncbi:class 1 isoprenoid biosynthesis enzyme [Cohnella luojiensis]|uniref:Class 1 isoprenoid biosynthesis enzyme n=1 Tax=Cohnella luojiensis TaxID=652876 RepID=A0A4Y8LN18_9BACL|nr:class 1 isoprenoid biosynthesis enzyme [Cohnella luojiensis]TFE19593.1 class 1 isoprenoid biosynthesis enzyme [Cohnella luojiensis]